MSTYYDILGLKAGAGSVEIKAAFRRLAKLYHPDKNPGGKEHFEKILRAYEVLSDPIQRSTYDYRLNYQQTASRAASSTDTKVWRFDEKEMKRRQYYNDHIKKYAKATASYEAEPEPKKGYNEYKYILFATPIAVGLFVLIMRLATPSGIRQNSAAQPAGPAAVQASAALQTGDTPYTHFFGGANADSSLRSSLTVNNQSGFDVVVCVFERKRFLRSCFISSGGSCEMNYLPKGPWQLRYSSGLNFDADRQEKQIPVTGIFTQTPRFYKSSKALAVKKLVLAEGVTTHFERVTEEEFFEKN